MLRISKLTDYGTLVLARLAVDRDRLHSASEVSAETGLGGPTVSKLLKQLTRAGLVTSERGANGGYRLAKEPAAISAADIIDALEGPLAITECSGDDSNCDLEPVCSVGSSWQRINIQIRRALARISLLELQQPQAEIPVIKLQPMPVGIGRQNTTERQ